MSRDPHALSASDIEILQQLFLKDEILMVDGQSVSKLAALGMIKAQETGWQITALGRKEIEERLAAKSAPDLPLL
ncbi:hypothetical protein [Hansschlegelia plantiphila]|uniref:Uncharacterized protein n=1 Tax=Hansschlegelia plantiphila TaxID=374655 RepID=A0A9W6IZ62_9HYPH|nr:hypothetical protein [Hansschlegelia plantiphila]GLK67727.1 hypothetical protein GCM10008179_13650 [Hansschlegelia plantiphila]